MVALCVAMGGVSYAAVTLPKNSVGPEQLRRNAVKPAKLAANSVRKRALSRGLRKQLRSSPAVRLHFSADAKPGAATRKIGTVNGLITGRPGEAARIRCPVWAGVGSEDPIMPPAQRDTFAAEMQAGGVDWRMVIYGGALHAFHYPIIRTDQILLPGVGYHPRHAQRAWRDVLELLAECLPVSE